MMHTSPVKDGTLCSYEARKLDKNNDQHIASPRDEAWCGFTCFAFDGSEKTISATVQDSAIGKLKVYTDRSKASITEIHVLASEEAKNFAGDLTLPAEQQPLHSVCVGPGALDFHCFQISLDTPAPMEHFSDLTLAVRNHF